MNTVWQADVDDTEPAISFDFRKQLRGVSKTIKFATREFDLETKPYAGNALLKKRTTVMFALMDSRTLLPIHVADRVVIGRLDVASSENAEIDLTPYNGRELGVSRRHAALYRQRNTMTLADLDSSNGTYLNGIKLISHQPRLLREDDEVRLGNMQFRVYFAQ